MYAKNVSIFSHLNGFGFRKQKHNLSPYFVINHSCKLKLMFNLCNYITIQLKQLSYYT